MTTDKDGRQNLGNTVDWVFASMSAGASPPSLVQGDSSRDNSVRQGTVALNSVPCSVAADGAAVLLSISTRPCVLDETIDVD